MGQRLAVVAARITAAFLLASLGLILAGAAGLGASLPLVAAFFAAALGLYAVRESIDNTGRVGGVDPGAILRVAWAGPLLAGLLVVATPGASPGELSAVGGLAGLVGMLNYFLRPVYNLLYAAIRSLGGGRSGPDRR